MAILISGILGWRVARLGQREWQAIFIVIVGWSVVSIVASVRFFTLDGLFLSTVTRALCVIVPYLLGLGARRLSDRR